RPANRAGISFLGGSLTTRVFVDCDPGIDDAVALAYLSARLDVEIAGVGAVFGNSGVEVTTDNALRLLELYGRPEVPVAWGASRPLVQPPRLAPHVHGVNGLGGVELPAPTGKPCEESAAELLVRLARENPGELDVLAVGPLTNLALALALEPRLPDLVRRLWSWVVRYVIPGTWGRTPRPMSPTTPRPPRWCSRPVSPWIWSRWT